MDKFLNQDPFRATLRKDNQEYVLRFYDASLDKQYKLWASTLDEVDQELERISKRLKRPYLLEKYL